MGKHKTNKRDIVTLLQLAIGSAKGAVKLMEDYDDEQEKKSDGNSPLRLLLGGGNYRNASRMDGSIENLEVVLRFIEAEEG